MNSMQRKEEALERFRNRCNCSQAVFTAYRQSEILDESTAMKLATVFGGGVAGSGNGLCGAVSGALLAISMRYGMGDPHAVDAKSATYALALQFMEAFRSRVGSCDCESILGMNIGTPENLQKARTMNLFATRCEQAVSTAADLLEPLV